MLADLSIASAVDLQSGAVEHEAHELIRKLRWQYGLESLRAMEVVYFDTCKLGRASLCKLWAKHLQCAQRQRKDLRETEEHLRECVRIDAWAATSVHVELEWRSEMTTHPSATNREYT